MKNINRNTIKNSYQLFDFIDNKLIDSERLLIEKQLEQSKDFQLQYEKLGELWHELSSDKIEQASPDFSAKVMMTIEQQGRKSRPIMSVMYRTAAVAAMLGGIVFGIYLGTHYSESKTTIATTNQSYHLLSDISQDQYDVSIVDDYSR